MKFTTLFIALLFLTTGAFALTETVLTYSDAGLTTQTTYFSNNSLVYVNISNGVTNGASKTYEAIQIYRGIPPAVISFRVWDNGTFPDTAANDFSYIGSFRISNQANNDTTDNVNLSDSESVQIEGDLDGTGITYLTVTADYLPPNITLLNPGNGSFIQSGTIINFLISDTASGINQTWWTNGTANYSMNNFINTTNWNEKQHNITVYSNDLIGNSVSKYYEFTVDDTPPSITNCTVVPNGTWLKIGDQFNVSSQGEANATAFFEYMNSNVSMPGNINYSNTTLITTNDYHNAILTCYLMDAAGNLNTTNSTETLMVDALAPNITLISPANESNFSAGQIINFSFVDTGIGVNKTWWSNGTNNFSMTNTINTSSWSEATHNITVYVNDSLGNTRMNYYEFTVDLTPLSITITNPPANHEYNESIIEWNITTSENYKECKLVITAFDNTTTESNQIGNTTNIFTGSLGPYSNGNYSLLFNCSDIVNNWNHTSVNVTVNDITPPTQVTGLTATGGNKKIALTWNTTLAGDLANYTIYVSTTNGGTYNVLTTITGTTYTHTGLGSSTTRYYIVAARDNEGNVGVNSTKASATTNKAKGGQTGGTGPSGSSRPPKPNYNDDPPEAVENNDPIPLPITLPTEKIEPEIVQQDSVIQEVKQEVETLTEPVTSAITGLLFQNGSLIFGLAALLAVVTIWMMWSASKQKAKRKWYEK